MKRRPPADTSPILPAELIAGPDTLRWADPEMVAQLIAGDALRRGNAHLPMAASVSAWRNYNAARRQWAAEHDLTPRQFVDMVRLERSRAL